MSQGDTTENCGGGGDGVVLAEAERYLTGYTGKLCSD